MRFFTASFFCLSVCFSAMFAKESMKVFESTIPIEIGDKPSGLDSIDCIYVVNLAVRPERWEGQQSRLLEYQLEGNRVEAVNGWQLPKEKLKEVPVARNALPLNPGQIGCFLSHISIWKDAFERNFERVWVMEDDVAFAQPPTALLPILAELDQMDPSWDILYTDPVTPCYADIRHHYLLPNPRIVEQYRSVSDNLVRINGRWGTHSMIISRRGLVKLLQYITNTTIFGPVDYQINFILSLNKYALPYNIAYHIRQESDTTTPPP